MMYKRFALILLCFLASSCIIILPNESNGDKNSINITSKQFVNRYISSVYLALHYIHHKPITDEHERYLILGADNKGYVQCVLHDNDTLLYCEAASGFYQKTKPEMSQNQREFIASQGFDTQVKQGNYTIDSIEVLNDKTLFDACVMMLRTLYGGYGQRGKFTIAAPIVSKDLQVP